jgi:1,4-alpha-glucan branching enzyme
MDPIAENSSNTLVGGGKVAEDDIARDGTGVVKLDPWLAPFQDSLKRRFSKAQEWIKRIEDTEGGLDKFSKGSELFGLQVKGDGSIAYREWAPNAVKASLIGDFSKLYGQPTWKPQSYISRQMGQEHPSHEEERIRRF